MFKVIGKAKFYEMCCTLDKCEDVEAAISDAPGSIQEVYKSDWTVDDDGDIVVHYAYRATHDVFMKFSKELNSEEYHELCNSMELLEL